MAMKKDRILALHYELLYIFYLYFEIIIGAYYKKKQKKKRKVNRSKINFTSLCVTCFSEKWAEAIFIALLSDRQHRITDLLEADADKVAADLRSSRFEISSRVRPCTPITQRGEAVRYIWAVYFNNRYST